MADENKTPNSNSDDENLGENGLKALRAERKRANDAEKERDALKKQLDDAEAQQLSERDAAIKRAEKAEAERDKYKSQLDLREAKERVLADEKFKDYADKLPALIHGDTEEALRESATAAVAILSEMSGPRTPKADNHLGKDNENQGNDDATALAALGFSAQ